MAWEIRRINGWLFVGLFITVNKTVSQVKWLPWWAISGEAEVGILPTSLVLCAIKYWGTRVNDESPKQSSSRSSIFFRKPLLKELYLRELWFRSLCRTGSHTRSSPAVPTHFEQLVDQYLYNKHNLRAQLRGRRGRCASRDSGGLNPHDSLHWGRWRKECSVAVGTKDVA